eukprot:GHVU01102635.1.p3 GENE.GHVU01102635.1~~GHVU01102635.1.p3  ORF type:complete len:100 (-),score=7.96 GHVU01102635.1:248-547(-)
MDEQQRLESFFLESRQPRRPGAEDDCVQVPQSTRLDQLYGININPSIMVRSLVGPPPPQIMELLWPLMGTYFFPPLIGSNPSSVCACASACVCRGDGAI